MATAATTIDPPAVVMDASFAVAYCAKEAGRFPHAKAQLEQYARDGCEFFAPVSWLPKHCLFFAGSWRTVN